MNTNSNGRGVQLQIPELVKSIEAVTDFWLIFGIMGILWTGFFGLLLVQKGTAEWILDHQFLQFVAQRSKYKDRTSGTDFAQICCFGSPSGFTRILAG